MKRTFTDIGIVFAATTLYAPGFAHGDWRTSVLCLQGDVRVELWTSAKSPDHAMVVSADEVDYNEVTGDVIPRGNVKVVVRNVQ